MAAGRRLRRRILSKCAASEDCHLTAGDVQRSPGTIETLFPFFSVHANVCSPACGPRPVLTLLPRYGTCSASCLHSPSRPPDASCCAILQALLLSPAYILLSYPPTFARQCKCCCLVSALSFISPSLSAVQLFCKLFFSIPARASCPPH